MTVDGSHGKARGGDITPAKFLYSLCVHYCNIQCYTILCACMCIFFKIILSMCQEDKHLLKLYQATLSAYYKRYNAGTTNWKRSSGQGMWKRVRSVHALSGNATLLATLPPPCVHQLESLLLLLLKFPFSYISV